MTRKIPLKMWILPAVLFICIAVVVVVTAALYHKSEKSHQLEKAVQISNAISKDMSREIEYRTTALKLASGSIHHVPTKIEFENIAKLLHDQLSGFFAINFIAADGVMSQTYPAEENRLALGRNVLERPDVRAYLLEAKADGQPRIGHRLFSYQKIYGVPIYVPLYDKEKKFLGWLNGLLSIDQCLNKYMHDPNLVNVTARLRWHYPSESSILEYNWNNASEFQTSDYKILNQTLSIDLALSKSPMDEWRQTLYIATIILRLCLLLIISLVIILLTRSKIKLEESVEQLCFKNNVISSLSHDLATPLTALHLLIDTATATGKADDSLKEKIAQSFKTVQGMLKTVRMLHSYNEGVNSLPIEKVNVLTSLKEAVNFVDPMVLSKKVHVEISPDIPADLFVKANAHTLVMNVFANAFSNAIKFSHEEGKIKIHHAIRGKKVFVILTDEGVGLSQVDLEKFERLSSIDTRAGTYGETGTGLGLLQISGFMKMYGGQIQLENNKPVGTKFTFIFEMA